MKGGQLHRGQPGRDRTDDADPARAEGRHGDGSEHYRQQRARQPRPAPPQEKEKPQDRQEDREDGWLDVAKPAGERADAGGGPTIIPSAVLLGLFAVIGTASIAKRVFGRRDAG